MSSPIRVPHRAHGNKMWPLPPEYLEVTDPRERAAMRRNACMQWTLPWARGKTHAERLHKTALVYLDCLRFFDRYYLWPDLETDFDPMFYDMVVEPPPLHEKVAYEGFVNRSVVQLMPRGLGKSYLVRKEITFKAVTKIKHNLVYTTSNHDNAMEAGAAIRNQLRENERILEDFGNMVPKRGEGAFNDRRITLNNGFRASFTSIDSAQRGKRPLEYILDDVEKDSKASTDMETVREHLDTLIKTVIKPMLQRPTTRFRWIGTPISNQHLITRVCADLLGMELDPGFRDHPSSRWTRVVHEILDPTDTTYGEAGRSIWPHLYPTNDKEKEDLGLHPETQTLENVEAEVGPSAWWSEYRLRPGRAAAQVFQIDPKFNTYEIINDDTKVVTNLSESKASLRWTRKQSGDTIERPLADIVKSGAIQMTLDTSYGESASSDYKVWHALVRTHEGDILSLDLELLRCNEASFIRRILEAAEQWRCPVVWPEYVVSQRSFCTNLENAVTEKLAKNLGINWIPKIKRNNVHNSPKQGRIRALGPYFEAGLIKLPAHRIHDRQDPYWMLRKQIENYNPNSRDGGLTHDDAIDTLAAILSTRKSSVGPFEDTPDRSDLEVIIEAFRQGETHWAGFLIGEIIPFNVLYPHIAAHEQSVHTTRKETAYGGSIT